MEKSMRMIDADALKENLKLPEESGRIGELPEMVIHAAIDDAPTIEERKTGKWIEDRVIPDAYDITGVKTWASVMRCDNCGFTMFSIEGHMGQYNYCPDCGAKMS